MSTLVLRSYETTETEKLLPSALDAGNGAPLAYSLQSSFKIGHRVAPSPLVSTSQLQAHLNLLKAFKDLKDRVEQRPQGLPQLAISLDAEKRWVWFLQLAVERFRRWVQNGTRFLTKESFVTREIPPLDVWMVWHSYMLNPTWYVEDCAREPTLLYLKWLNEWDGLVPEVLGSIGNFSSFVPTRVHNARWHEITRLPFDPFESSHALLEHFIICPRCSLPMTVPYLAYDGKSETGYAQIAFKHECPKCAHHITKATLAVAKFARDVARDPSNLADVKSYGSGVYFPGTLDSPVAKNSETRARDVKNSVAKSSAFLNSQVSYANIPFGAIRQLSNARLWESDIKKKVGFSLDTIRTHLLKELRPTVVSRILSAYYDDRPFSVDLVGAVLRQGVFVEKIDELGWTRSKSFESSEDQLVLHHCIARYHAFLDLVSSSPSSLFVPTLDIDLVWHTHQLCPERYTSDCMTYIKRYVDHEDKVEESRLSNSFDATCRAWQQRFSIPYMYCGCPVPGDKFGQKLSRLATNIVGHKFPISPPDREDCLLGTHPSDHNSVYTFGVSQEMRQKRMIKNKKRRDRDIKSIEEGKMDVKVYLRGETHSVGFMVPVSIYYPVGYVDHTESFAAGIERSGGVVFGGASGEDEEH